LRFVWGAGYAARNMTKFLYATRSKDVYALPNRVGEAPARQTETASNVS